MPLRHRLTQEMHVVQEEVQLLLLQPRLQLLALHLDLVLRCHHQQSIIDLLKMTPFSTELQSNKLLVVLVEHAQLRTLIFLLDPYARRMNVAMTALVTML